MDGGASTQCGSRDEDRCEADGACWLARCPGCRRELSLCLPSNTRGAFACPRVACPPCSQLGSDSCGAETGCASLICEDCTEAGQFVCYDPQGPVPSCPRVDCACAGLSPGECFAAPDCHGVYLDEPGNCACDEPGCCMVFQRCTSPGRAQCGFFGGPLCTLPAPTCGEGFSVRFVDECWDGARDGKSACSSVPAFWTAAVSRDGFACGLRATRQRLSGSRLRGPRPESSSRSIS